MTNTLIKVIIVLIIATDLTIIYYFGIRETPTPKAPIELNYPLDDSGYIPRNPDPHYYE